MPLDLRAPETWVSGVMLAALVVYALTGGADFGGGVWDLLALGNRGRLQRQAIERSIGPIWEANHVWLILVIVLMFVCFPKAYATIGIALHLPLTGVLLGVVARGSAFVFRKYDSHKDTVHFRWSLVFGTASLVTPLLFGASLGALASGRLRIGDDGMVVTNYFEWFSPFPLVVGGFALSLFAFAAAVHLAADVSYRPLQEDFRRRALVSGVVTGVFAFATLGFAYQGAPRIFEGLLASPFSVLFQVLTAVAAISALVLLWLRRYAVARIVALVQIALIVAGWGATQFPYVVVPDLTFAQAAAPSGVLWTTLAVLGVGSLALVPAFVWLYRVFRGRTKDSQLG